MPTQRKVLEMTKNFHSTEQGFKVVKPSTFKIGSTKFSYDSGRLLGKPLDLSITTSKFKKNIDILIKAAEEMIERTKRY